MSEINPEDNNILYSMREPTDYSNNQHLLLNLPEKSLLSNTEQKYLLRYKKLSGIIDEEKKKLHDIQSEICTLIPTNNKDKIRDLQNATIDIHKLIDEYTEQLRTLETIYPLYDILKREKTKMQGYSMHAFSENSDTKHQNSLDEQSQEELKNSSQDISCNKHISWIYVKRLKQKYNTIRIIAFIFCVTVSVFLISFFKMDSVKYSTNEVEVDTYVCYVTDTGSKYHAKGCQYLRKSSHYTTVYQAENDGYTGCSRCTPWDSITIVADETTSTPIKTASPVVITVCICLFVPLYNIIVTKSRDKYKNAQHLQEEQKYG